MPGEDAVSEAEQTLRQIIDGIPGFIITITAQGEVEFVSRPNLEYVGKTLDELRGMAGNDFHPDDIPRMMAAWDQSFKTGQAWDIEHRIRRADGVYRWVHSRCVPQRDAEGRTIRCYNLLTDIDDRKRAEEKLRRSEADLLEAQRLSHTGSWRHNVLSGEITVSPEVIRIRGIQPHNDASKAEFFFDRIHPDDRDRVREIYKAAQIQKTDYEVAFRIVLADGTIKHLHTIGHPVLDESGELVEFFGTAMDVTDRERLGRELQHERDRLRLLLDLNNRVESHLHVRQLFQAISTELRRVFQCDFVGLVLPENDGKQLRQHMIDFAESRDLFKVGALLPMEGSSAGLAFRTAKAVVLNSVAEKRTRWR